MAGGSAMAVSRAKPAIIALEVPHCRDLVRDSAAAPFSMPLFFPSPLSVPSWAWGDAFAPVPTAVCEACASRLRQPVPAISGSHAKPAAMLYRRGLPRWTAAISWLTRIDRAS
jgi:hypothetical protein